MLILNSSLFSFSAHLKLELQNLNSSAKQKNSTIIYFRIKMKIFSNLRLSEKTKTNENHKLSSWDFINGMLNENIYNLRYLRLKTSMELLFVNFKSKTKIESLFKIDEAPLEFSFQITGTGTGTISHTHRSEEKIISNSCKTIISFNPDSKCRAIMPENQIFNCLNIYIKPEALYDLLNQELENIPEKLHKILETGKSSPFNFIYETSPFSKIILKQIYDCPYSGSLGKLFIESKAIELVVNQLWELGRLYPGNKKKSLSKQDIEKIYRARKILISDLENPPSVKELASLAGINETKLKKGFRQVFDSSVFEYFRNYRMDLSLDILKQGDFNVNETAYMLGFHDETHFIKNFKKEFGTTPGVFLKDCVKQKIPFYTEKRP